MIIIPDIHGRAFWKEPADEAWGKEHIIFLGDYLDPYEDEMIAPLEVFPNLEQIAWLKAKQPEKVTLLLGNHDIHYLTQEGRGSRYDYIRGAQYKHFFQDNAKLFQLAYETEIAGKKIIFSHAGIKAGWIEANKEYLEDVDASNIASSLNEMWSNNASWPVLFHILGQVPESRWGYSKYGSPIWNDIEDMVDDPDELPGLYQIIGHSQQDKDPVLGDHIACLDCRRAFRINDKGSIREL